MIPLKSMTNFRSSLAEPPSPSTAYVVYGYWMSPEAVFYTLLSIIMYQGPFPLNPLYPPDFRIETTQDLSTEGLRLLYFLYFCYLWFLLLRNVTRVLSELMLSI